MRNEAVRDFDPELVLRPRCLCPADQDADVLAAETASCPGVTV